jgi:hypothetical protein
MTKDEALDLALEALSPWMDTDADHTEQHAAYYAVKQALAAPVQEPDLIARLKHPEQHYEFTDPKKANAVLMSLCQEAADALAAPVRERTDYAVHLNHCNIGECEGVCKYLDDDCPALKHADMKAKWDKTTPPAAQPAPVQDLPFGVGGGLVAIKTLLSRDPCVHANTAIEMIDAILKEHPAAQPAPVQEPVAWRYDLKQTGSFAGVSTEYSRIKLKIGENWTPLYTTPPAAQRQWVGLSQDELDAMFSNTIKGKKLVNWVSRAIEAKLKQKNIAAQPAVPDAFGTREGEHPQYIEGWNDCRAEMLKGMKP